MGKKFVRRLLHRRQWLLGAIATAGFIFGITSTARGTEPANEKAGEGGRVSDHVSADAGTVSGHVSKEGAPIEGLTVRIFRKADRQVAQSRVHRMGEAHSGGSGKADGEHGNGGGAGKGEHEGDAKKYQAVTDASGAFSFADLPAGKWGIFCESGGGYRAWKLVTVTAGQATDAELTLEKSKPAPERNHSGVRPNAGGGGGANHENGEHSSPASRK